MYLALKIYQNELMIFGNDRKRWQNSAVQRKKVICEKNLELKHREEGGGSRYSFAR